MGAPEFVAALNAKLLENFLPYLPSLLGYPRLVTIWSPEQTGSARQSNAPDKRQPKYL
jgi:hypothetical protein